MIIQQVCTSTTTNISHIACISIFSSSDSSFRHLFAFISMRRSLALNFGALIPKSRSINTRPSFAFWYIFYMLNNEYYRNSSSIASLKSKNSSSVSWQTNLRECKNCSKAGRRTIQFDTISMETFGF